MTTQAHPAHRPLDKITRITPNTIAGSLKDRAADPAQIIHYGARLGPHDLQIMGLLSARIAVGSQPQK